jgi:hypothetical protein
VAIFVLSPQGDRMSVSYVILYTTLLFDLLVEKFIGVTEGGRIGHRLAICWTALPFNSSLAVM